MVKLCVKRLVTKQTGEKTMKILNVLSFYALLPAFLCIPDISDYLFTSQTIKLHSAFTFEINPSKISQTFHTKFYFSDDIDTVIIMKYILYDDKRVTHPDCYPFKLGVYYYYMDNDDYIFYEPFLQYSFKSEENQMEHYNVPLIKRNQFLSSYSFKSNCRKSQTTAKIIGVSAYHLVNASRCRNSSYSRLIVWDNYAGRNNTYCFKSDQLAMEWLKMIGDVFDDDDNDDTSNKNESKSRVFIIIAVLNNLVVVAIALIIIFIRRKKHWKQHLAVPESPNPEYEKLNKIDSTSSFSGGLSQQEIKSITSNFSANVLQTARDYSNCCELIQQALYLRRTNVDLLISSTKGLLSEPLDSTFPTLSNDAPVIVAVVGQYQSHNYTIIRKLLAQNVRLSTKSTNEKYSRSIMKFLYKDEIDEKVTQYERKKGHQFVVNFDWPTEASNSVQEIYLNSELLSTDVQILLLPVINDLKEQSYLWNQLINGSHSVPSIVVYVYDTSQGFTTKDQQYLNKIKEISAKNCTNPVHYIVHSSRDPGHVVSGGGSNEEVVNLLNQVTSEIVQQSLSVVDHLADRITVTLHSDMRMRALDLWFLFKTLATVSELSLLIKDIDTKKNVSYCFISGMKIYKCQFKGESVIVFAISQDHSKTLKSEIFENVCNNEHLKVYEEREKKIIYVIDLAR